LNLRYCAEREFSIGVAAGANKHPVVRASIRARYLNVLVTDEATARFLLEGKSNSVRDECGVDDERR
jgi:deoxyribonucleoside regulator